MPFVSFAFIGFMCAVALAYYMVPKAFRWTVLLVASYVFFWLNSEWLLLALFVQSLGTFLFGLWIQRVDDKCTASLPADLDRKQLKQAKVAIRTKKRRVMALGIVFNVGALLTMKYFDFFADSANMLLGLFGVQLPSLGILAPIGLSFYTLQAIAYLVDLRRSKMPPDTNPFKFLLFMSYFPQIVQGPIPRHSQLAHQLYEGHSFDYKRLCYGAQLILWGFMKKLILADRLSIPVNQIFDNWTYYDGLIVFLAAAAYGIQVYADFSGGIDIARGFSQVLGIELEQNFRQPYFSKSMTELWRRWHITLGTFTREYVFYPLSMSKAFTKFGRAAGNVVGAKTGRRLAPCVATFVAFLFVGFWHGPKWTYVGYGVYNGVFLALATVLPEFYALLKRKLHVDESTGSWLFFQMSRTFVVASCSRFFTRATSLRQSLDMIGSIADGWYDLSFLVDGTLLNLGVELADWFVIIAMIGVMIGVGVVHEHDISVRDIIARQGIVARWFVYLAALMAVVVLGAYGEGYDAAAFIYQQY